MNNEVMLNKIESIVNEYGKLYQECAAKSRGDYMSTLPEGSPAPAAGRIYTDAYKNAFIARGTQLAEQAEAVIDMASRADMKETLTPPSRDVLDVLQVLQMRKDITAAEIEGALQMYGSNYQCFKVLRDIAGYHGIDTSGFTHELEGRAEYYKTCRENVKKLFAPMDHANNGYDPKKASFALSLM